MKALLVVLAAIVLTACSPGYEEKHYSVLPNELKDCKFYNVTDGGSTIKVVRCPNSQVTTTWTTSTGKSSVTHTVVTIDGVQYQKVEN